MSGEPRTYAPRVATAGAIAKSHPRVDRVLRSAELAKAAAVASAHAAEKVAKATHVSQFALAQYNVAMADTLEGIVDSTNDKFAKVADDLSEQQDKLWGDMHAKLKKDSKLQWKSKKLSDAEMREYMAELRETIAAQAVLIAKLDGQVGKLLDIVAEHISITAVGAPSPYAPVAAPSPILHDLPIVLDAHVVEKEPGTPIHDDDDEDEPQGIRQEIAEQERRLAEQERSSRVLTEHEMEDADVLEMSDDEYFVGADGRVVAANFNHPVYIKCKRTGGVVLKETSEQPSAARLAAMRHVSHIRM